MSLNLDVFQTMALATIVFYFGDYVKRKIKILERYCIPSAVVGGMIFSVIVLILNLTNILKINLDTSLQSILMTIFFTSIGYTASLKVLKTGGKKVLVFLGLSVGLVIAQDIIGVIIAKFFGINPLLGLATGSIPLVGGHGTAGSFGPLLEEVGVSAATTVSFASATFGLIMGSILGGFIAESLIEKNKIDTSIYKIDKNHEVNNENNNSTNINYNSIIKALSLIFITMGIGSIITIFIQSIGLTFPSYIGSMITAAVIKNIMDFKNHKIEDESIEVIGNISLVFYLSLALMGLKLWELFDLALPMIVMLIIQTIIMFIFGYFIVFKIMGKNYEAAVFSSAMCGFGMGSTANSIANMDALTSKYGFIKTPYIVVPIVGGLFIDFINSGVITLFINMFK
ncbi:sodium/glutamate symporter [Clostridium sp. Sa3CUN1]|uniref:Sodium/glutamate symporter n=1 Tax=Clostridium gallinarum TaxID=2762246 RepID=A0ABR8Q6G4_9CLOT|nr:sodium/glutamate symporter [Clostridium gallinarum]MBD7915989.1 sodium/glutamate symporter [Clostridium gallinarum]